jgi:DNA-directed RNA polymerase specialized sigma subunit
MKQILYESEVNVVALLKKHKGKREVAQAVGLSQSKVIRIGKKYFENIVICQG